MTSRILFLGQGGSRLAESFLWAAAAGVLHANGKSMENVQILCVDETPEALPRLTPQLDAYQQVRSIMPEDSSWPGFRTALTVTPWETGMQNGSLSKTEEETLLWQALTAGDDASSLQQKQKAIDFAMMLQHLPEDSRLRQWLGTNPETLLLCGYADDEDTAARLPLLTQYLKETVQNIRLGVLLLLPEQDENRQTAEALLQQDGWQQDAAYLLGMPEDCRQARDMAEPRLTDWLSIHCAVHFFCQDGQGCFAYRAKENGMSWRLFGDAEKDYRQGYGSLLRLALLAEGTVNATVTAALQGKNVLQARGMGCDAAFYRYVKKLLQGEQKKETWQAVMTLLHGFAAWMEQMTSAVPAAMRNKETQRAMQLSSGENYRKLLDAYGSWMLMEEEIHRSGMDTESVVRRGEIQENEADETLRLAREQHDEVLRLEGNQRVWDRRTGGMAKLRLMEQMAEGIEAAIDREEQQVQADRKALDMDTENLSLRHSLHRLENHLRLLRAQLQRVTADQDAGEAEQIDRLPPVLPENEKPENGLVDSRLWVQMKALKNTDEVRDRKALWAEASQLLPDAVQGGKGTSVQEALQTVADKKYEKLPEEGASPLGILLERLLCAVQEETP
ncbi:MAG: hypothetical protein Q4B32_00815 [Clostridia bacterium]|nr:hypothetical protein [Clostridia bacterium]